MSVTERGRLAPRSGRDPALRVSFTVFTDFGACEYAPHDHAKTTGFPRCSGGAARRHAAFAARPGREAGDHEARHHRVRFGRGDADRLSRQALPVRVRSHPVQAEHDGQVVFPFRRRGRRRADAGVCRGPQPRLGVCRGRHDVRLRRPGLGHADDLRLLVEGSEGLAVAAGGEDARLGTVQLVGVQGRPGIRDGVRGGPPARGGRRAVHDAVRPIPESVGLGDPRRAGGVLEGVLRRLPRDPVARRPILHVPPGGVAGPEAGKRCWSGVPTWSIGRRAPTTRCWHSRRKTNRSPTRS